MSCPYYAWRDDYYCTKNRDFVGDSMYWQYCRAYNYEECPSYRDGDYSEERPLDRDGDDGDYSSGCFLTTACVRAKNLPDNCEELTTLRDFRDTWLTQQPNGTSIIEEYYKIAPKIVASINKTATAEKTWTELYEKLVAPCVEMIKNDRKQEAFRLYESVTQELRNTYLA
jgi:3'-phosphoadenosine 5'-phosphosulfate sulfotransferase (PAPS reductase)/FAD synthetase